MTAAGRKRYRITIQRKKTTAEGLTPAASGKADETDNANWKTHAERWAEIIEPSGREWQQNGQVRSETTHLVTIPWDPETKAITTRMRIQWPDGGTDRYLDITKIGGKTKTPNGPRWDLLIEAKEHS